MSFGRDIYSFTRAAAVRRVLVTPTLPVVRRMSSAAVPPAWGAAIACIALPMILSLAWLVFVRQFDRGRPEPWWLVLATFALGAVGVVPAAFAEAGLQALTPYLSPSVMTLGGQLLGLPVALGVFTLTVGVVEEGAKLLGAWALARHRREFDEPVDGIVYGCASALGFAAAENMKYFAFTRLSGAVVAYRAFLSVPAYMFFGAIWGYALGRKLVRKETSVVGWFLVAALAHGAFDTFLSIDGVQIFAIVLDVALGLVFIELLRKSLRFGTVAGEGGAPASSGRALFRVGSRGQYVVLVVLVLLLAGAVMTLGTAYEILQHRVGVVFIGIGSTILALFGVVAWFLTQSIPLDVAIDEVGVTFAGATSRWRQVLRFEPVLTRLLFSQRGWVLLHTTDGTVRLGPCAPATTEQMTTVLGGYMARAREAGDAPPA